MCCGFYVSMDGMVVGNAIFMSGGGGHEPDSMLWIQAMKKGATAYYEAARENPDKTVVLGELASPCDDYHELAATRPGEETQQVDPTKACPDVRAWIDLQSVQLPSLRRRVSDNIQRGMATSHTKERTSFEETRRKWPSE